MPAISKPFIHKTAVVENARIGEGTKIWHFVHIMNGTRIGKHCSIGDYVHMDRNVVVGDRCKIQNAAILYDGVTIGNDVFIGPSVCFTNDLRPRAFNQDWTIIKTAVKDGASIGANATIICGVTIGRHAMVGAGSVVTEDVPDFGLVYGNPAHLHGFVCKCGSRVDKAGSSCQKCKK